MANSKHFIRRNHHYIGRDSTLLDAQPPAESWQVAAKQLLDAAQNALWSSCGTRPLEYLKRRGLTDETILRARLGYIPGRIWEHLRVGELLIPCGISIPWFVGQELWAVRIRRPAGLPKYARIAGSSTQGLYNTASLTGQHIALFVECELDALLIEQELGQSISTVMLGNTAVTLNTHWLPMLLRCETIMIVSGPDEAALKRATRLQTAIGQARVISLPLGKTITEFVGEGGKVKQWLNEML